MLVVSGDTITVTRADDFVLHVDIMMQDGVLYNLYEDEEHPENNDKFTFILYKKPSKLLDNPPIFSKSFNGNEVSISSQETQFLNDDRYYYACVLDSKQYGRNTVAEGLMFLTY